MSDYHFGLNVETNEETGEIMAVYFRVRKGKAANTREYADGNLFADYDRRGNLLGIEMLGPCKATVLDRITRVGPERRFVRESVPRGMLARA